MGQTRRRNAYENKHSHKRFDEGWNVKNNRPEETYGNPLFFYTPMEVEKSARSGGMRKAQERIANNVVEMLNLGKGSKILDMGCGPGYTSAVYQNMGFEVIGLDVTPQMVEKANERGIKAYVGDMRNVGEIFAGQQFDGIVSVSALQWLKEEGDIRQVAEGTYGLLGTNAPLIFQFYPRSESELEKTASIFKRNGFVGDIITKNPDNPRTRTLYLDLKKIK
ncbi:MAG: class I SAM-dependent methyltransferase [Nanoarchaeota archaeon]|nr:class I SAM-dependent methyltransferase [Nanoarchaeota archaeon]